MQSVKNLWNTVVGGGGATTDAPQKPVVAMGGTTLAALHTIPALHKERVWCVAWHPRGHLLASCGADNTVCLFDASGTCVKKIETPHDRTIRRVAFSPDGRTLAACSFDSTVTLWCLNEDGSSVTGGASLEGHENEVKGVAFSACGDLVATCSRDKTVWVWDPIESEHNRADVDDDDDQEVTEYECMAVLSGHSQDVKSVVWNPKKEELFSCSYDDTVRVWVQSEARDGEWFCDATLQGHTSTVWQVAVDPISGDRIVSCSDDGCCIVWSRADGDRWRNACTLSGAHVDIVYTVAWGAHNVIASGGGDNSIVCYEESAIEDVASRGSGAVSFVQTVSVKNAHRGDVNAVAWNPVDTNILASCGDDGCIRIWRYQ